MNTSVCVLGAAGRMGQSLVRHLCAGTVPGLSLTGAAEQPECPALGRDAGTLAGCGACNVPLTADLAAAAAPAAVLIDFSAHAAAPAHAAFAAEQGKALVLGATGLDATERAAVAAAAAQAPIVLAPNMSLGVNLLLALLEQAGAALRDKGYDVEIIERHHRRKQDAPSGTALALGQAVAAGLEWNLDEVARHGREGLGPARPAREIGFHAVRGGDIVGDHTVLFAAEGECLEFSHRATQRDTFVLGALRAAAWLVGRPPGLYRMADVLGL
ncbi:MAG: 4-hydroxy-tetrahydrodipicolinate reductase [Candidatus Marinimicrobia bacterium]|nr:4-hydroxy-tetrahydrodipicolinate reductase [Candidatus Neomarinimicrobiota bacterium]